MVLGDFLWSNTSTCIYELEPRRVVELLGDFCRAHAAVPLRFGLSGLNRIIQPNPLFMHENHSRNAQVRIIRHRVGSSGTVQWQKVLFGRIIRPMGGSSDHGDLTAIRSQNFLVVVGSSGVGSDHPIRTDLQCL